MEPTLMITDKMLDDAGVQHWRARLADAREADARARTHRVNYDLAWHAIKAEYRNALELARAEVSQ